MKFLRAEEYQEKCTEKFEYFHEKVIKLLPTARIEHIGASSIPGAVSKGDLDIFVGVQKSELELSVKALKLLGFKEKQNTLRTPELCMLESKTADVAFQVVANGSMFEDFLIFRDKMRKSPELVQQYNELKLSCTGWPHNKYREKKSVFVEKVLAQTKQIE